MSAATSAVRHESIGRHGMTHARRTGHHFLRHLHPGGWLKDTRDLDFAVGKLIAPLQVTHRDGPSN